MLARPAAASIESLLGSPRALTLEATLADLPQYQFSIETTCLGLELAQLFESQPDVPGALLTQSSELVGMISRSHFLEFLLHPHSSDLFLQQPLSVLHSYIRTKPLILPIETLVTQAAEQALARAIDTLQEPIVVQVNTTTYRILDFKHLNLAHWQLQRIETQVWYERMQTTMIRQDKMASLGRLVDGVSHEILDPVSFIWGNLSHVSTYIQDLLKLLSAFEALNPELPPSIQKLREEVEFDYLQEDLPKTLDSIKTGVDRLSKLATSLQNFCHIDEIYPKPANLHGCLDGVLLLINSHLKSEIKVVKEYGHLPPVPCFIGQITQVFMNIFSWSIEQLINQAVGSSIHRKTHHLPLPEILPTIRVVTETCAINSSGSRWISIRIGHNGPAISIEEQNRLSANFAQANLLTQETSLLTSYRIVTMRHRGQFRLRTVLNPADSIAPGMSTEFEILLPLA